MLVAVLVASAASMGTAILVLRCVLAVVFATAAVSKALDRPGTRQAAEDFGLARRYAALAAIGLPAVEILIAVSLLVQVTARAGAVAALLLLVAFSVAIGRLMRRGEAPECHCFGQLQSSVAGPSTLARNAGLAVLAAVAVAAGPGTSLAALSGQELALLATAVSTALLAAVVVGLWRENRALRAGGAVAAGAGEPARGLPRGSRLPAVGLLDLDGSAVDLGGLVGEGKPAVIVQVGVDCGPCHDLLPELVRWRASLADALTMIVVSSGDLDANRSLAEQFGLPALLVGERDEIASAFALTATPSAVLVDGRGRIAAAPVLGAPGVEALVRRELGASASLAGRA